MRASAKTEAGITSTPGVRGAMRGVAQAACPMEIEMKLARFDDDRTGLLVATPPGPVIMDILASLGNLAPADLISNGILNGTFGDGNSRSALMERWRYAKTGLNRLASAAAYGRWAGLMMHRPYPLCFASRAEAMDGIIGLEITEAHSVRESVGREKVAQRPTESEVVSKEIAPQSAESNVVFLDVLRTSRRSLSK
jgi:hypothetical protein